MKEFYHLSISLEATTEEAAAWKQAFLAFVSDFITRGPTEPPSVLNISLNKSDSVEIGLSSEQACTCGPDEACSSCPEKRRDWGTSDHPMTRAELESIRRTGTTDGESPVLPL